MYSRKTDQWGQENEPAALKAYEAIMENNHEDLKIIKSGLKLFNPMPLRRGFY